MAETVYVTARALISPSNTTGAGANQDGTYSETGITLGDTSAKSSVADAPSTRGGSRAYTSSPLVTSQSAGIDIKPVLAIGGAAYLIEYTFDSSANNVTTNAIFSASCTGGTLSFSSTDKFQRKYGTKTWQTVGYITNAVGNLAPTISFRYSSGRISSAENNRLIVDCFRFTLAQLCQSVASPSIDGPVAIGQTAVTVTGVAANATDVSIYQITASGTQKIGEKASGLVAGNNSIPVTGLVKLAQIAATQTIAGQESCVPSTGLFVGGGANPSVRIALSIRETSSTGPVGQTGNTGSGIVHFLGATQVSSQAPIDAPVFYPSNTWQTVSFQYGTATVGDVPTAFGNALPGSGYAANDYVDIKVYAYETINGSTAYSANPVFSAGNGYTSSNDVYRVQWTWDAVPGATGYRLLRQTNFFGYNDYRDVTNNSYTDSNTGWTVGSPTLTPNSIPLSPSIQWNPTVGNANNIATSWGILDSIDFAINGTDSGPFDLYIDNVQNGTTVFQTFENGTSIFRQPSFSGTTSGNILANPNVSAVTNIIADTGTNSLHVRFQFSGTNNTKWLRFTTSGADPMVNMTDPISFRMLLLPVGAQQPQAPPGKINAGMDAKSHVILNWTGSYTLQTATSASGPYTDVAGPVLNSPYTNTFSGAPRFFRLRQ